MFPPFTLLHPTVQHIEPKGPGFVGGLGGLQTATCRPPIGGGGGCLFESVRRGGGGTFKCSARRMAGGAEVAAVGLLVAGLLAAAVAAAAGRRARRAHTPNPTRPSALVPAPAPAPAIVGVGRDGVPRPSPPPPPPTLPTTTSRASGRDGPAGGGCDPSWAADAEEAGALGPVVRVGACRYALTSGAAPHPNACPVSSHREQGLDTPGFADGRTGLLRFLLSFLLRFLLRFY